MINAHELRIGNWVNATKEVGIYPAGFHQVYEINEDGVGRSMGDSNIYDFADLEGIPLTPALLERCGFMKKGEYAVGAGSYRSYNHPSGFSLYGDVPDTSPIKSSACKMPIESLHQLQNLFFALTGEELTITL